MMQELNPTEWGGIRPLLHPLSHFLTLDSILTGRSPGRVFGDDKATPQVVVAGFRHRQYLAGWSADTTGATAVNHLLHQVIIPAAQARGEDAFVLHVTEAWRPFMPLVLAGLDSQAYPRAYYRLQARGREWQPRLAPGLRLRPVDAALLADTQIRNLAWVKEEMVSERPSLADFLAYSFGYAVQHGEEIVAWCMSEYNSGSRCELGIATLDNWQRQGLATAVATAVISHALTQGIEDIGWVCWQGNRPSVATAEKLGFQLHRAELVYLIIIG